MKLNHAATVTGEGYGYVYVMSYPGSDKVKIGHTLNPSVRAKNIGGTLAPEQPVIELLFWCSERREDVERAAHKRLADYRHNGEWFTIGISRALEVVRQAASKVGLAAELVHDRNEWEAKKAQKLAEEEQQRVAKLVKGQGEEYDAAEKSFYAMPSMERLKVARDEGSKLIALLTQHYPERVDSAASLLNPRISRMYAKLA